MLDDKEVFNISEIEVRSGRIVQIMPVPIGWHYQEFLEGKPVDEPWRVVCLALVELELADPGGEEPWTGRDLYPVGEDLHVYGLPDGAEVIFAFGELSGSRGEMLWRDE